MNPLHWALAGLCLLVGTRGDSAAEVTIPPNSCQSPRFNILKTTSFYTLTITGLNLSVSGDIPCTAGSILCALLPVFKPAHAEISDVVQMC